MYKNITLYLNTLYIYINKHTHTHTHTHTHIYIYIYIQGGAGWGKQNPSSSHHLPEIDLCRIEFVK